MEKFVAVVLDTLERARKQIPRQGPGLVCVRVPEEWGTSPAFEAVCLLATGDFFRNTKRILGVLILWEQLDVQLGEGAVFSVPVMKCPSWNCDTMPHHLASQFLDRLFVVEKEELLFLEFTAAYGVEANS